MTLESVSSCVELNDSTSDLTVFFPFSDDVFSPQVMTIFLFKSFGAATSLLHTFKITSINCCLFSSFVRNFFQSAGFFVFSPLMMSLDEVPLPSLSIDLIEFERYVYVLNTASDLLSSISSNLREICLKLFGRTLKQ